MNLALSFAFLLQLAFLLGITVWLPIASTAQVQLLANLFPSVSGMLMPLAGGIFRLAAAGMALYMFRNRIKDNGASILVLSAPSLLVWLVLGKLMPDFLSDPVVIAIVTAAAGAILLVVCSVSGKRRSSDLRSCFAAGCTGALALIPGVGILTALLCGLIATGQSEDTAYPLAVIGSVPLILVQSFQILGSASWSVMLHPAIFLLLAAGVILAGLVAGVMLRLVSLWLRSHTLKVVGLVRCAFGIFLLLLYCVF